MCALAALSKTEAMAAVCWARCSPFFPRSGLVAGEVVELFRQIFFFFLVPLAGRGGEGRSWWSMEICFWFWWCRWSPLEFLLRPALVARGVESGGGLLLALVVVRCFSSLGWHWCSGAVAREGDRSWLVRVVVVGAGIRPASVRWCGACHGSRAEDAWERVSRRCSFQDEIQLLGAGGYCGPRTPACKELLCSWVAVLLRVVLPPAMVAGLAWCSGGGSGEDGEIFLLSSRLFVGASFLAVSFLYFRICTVTYVCILNV